MGSLQQDLKKFEGANGKFGYLDAEGKEVVSPIYQKAFDFKDGLGIVVLNDKWGYIDPTGKVVVPLKYDELHWFADDFALANIGATMGEFGYPIGGKYGYIDRSGREVVSFIYDKAGSFSEGIAPVNMGATRGKYSMTGGKYGYIDKSGKEVIPISYDQASKVSEGLAAVTLNSKAGYIDKTGKEIIPLKYDRAGLFTNGLACVKLNGKYGYINPSDVAVIPFEFDEADNNFANGLACVKQNGLYGFIDRTGKFVIPLKFENANSFMQNMANVKIGKKWGYIDTMGNFVLDAKYDYAGMFVDGKAKVKLDEKEFYINQNGKIVSEMKILASENKKPKSESKPASGMEGMIARMKERDEELKKLDKNYKGSNIKAVEESYEQLKKVGDELKTNITNDAAALIRLTKIIGNKNLNELMESARSLGVNNFTKGETQSIHPISGNQEKCVEYRSDEKILDKKMVLYIYEYTSGDFAIFCMLTNPYFKNLNDQLASSGLKLIEKTGGWQYWGNGKGVMRLVDIDGPNGFYGGDCIIFNK